ncbi:MAG: gamma-glutamylcyclotransferase [candidate division KSB1 bacterium]|nr:gamma-glutamylcyclotransferase [candidate division KSB1 bacterium]MDZ7273367.1 gamma-glutamylcyclotransferase [candidate division KSB1 bacterium]MDZ7288029.1 gamma-glutamylcyclotransferase [candidate division KSB1 bacterium]MDZ7300119.1 gamma-glutamylcyclotransferase [candidate division KSB1 bacterium]MDZ7308889.1 gamma-glutamylcyclotransferase [candidate division KSB1 bacterium]
MLFIDHLPKNTLFRLRPRRAPAAETTDLLFVYGTLMRGMERADFLNNPDKASFAGPATAAGKLYDVGSFPGMIESDNGERVHGELHRLQDPELFFETLDLIQGYWPDQPERSLYIRKIIPVTTAQGTTQAWSYILNLPVNGLKPIPSGDFRRYQPTDHWLDD